MTIAFRSIGTVGTGSTSVTAGLPGSMVTGDGVLLFVETKPDTATVNTPANWTLVADVAGGGGTTGQAVGPTRQAVFFREKDASWSSMPAVSVTNGNATAAAALAYSKASTAAWQVAAGTGTYGSGGSTTAANATLGSNPGITAGDMCVVGYSSMVDTPAWSGQGITATGISAWGTATERSEVIETTTNNDVGGMVFDRPVTTGTATANPATQATASVATRGTVALVRLRELTPSPALGTASLSITATATAADGSYATITHVASTTNIANTAATTIDATVPAQTQGGDLLIWSEDGQIAAGPVDDPVGWTRVVQGSTTALHVTTWMKFAAGTPGATSSEAGAVYTTPPVATAARTSTSITAMRGVDPSTPLEAVVPTPIAGTTALTFPAVTVSTPGAWGFAVAGHTYSAGGTGAIVPVVLAVLGETITTGASGVNVALTHLGGQVSGTFTPGATPNTTTTRTLGITFALRPKNLTAPTAASATASLSLTASASASAVLGVPFTDDFNRSDAATLGSNWTGYTNMLGVVSNQAAPASTSIHAAFSNALSTGDNQTVTVTVGSFGGATGIILNAPATNGVDEASTGEYYLLRYSGGTVGILRKQANAVTFSTLASTSLTLSSAATLRGEREGTAIRFYIDGTLAVSATDPTPITGNRRAGLRTSGSTATRYDDFSLTDLVVATPATGTASLSLSAAAGSGAPVTGSAAVALAASGSARGSATGTASLALAATGGASSQTAVTGTATLALSASGAARTAATATASLALAATGGAATLSAATGTASLALAAFGTARAAATGTAPLALAATGGASSQAAATGTAVLALVAAGGAQSAGSAIAFLALAAFGTASSPASGTASLALTASAAGRAAATSSATLTLNATGQAAAPSTSSAALVLTATGAAAGATSGTAALSISGFAGTAGSTAATGAAALAIAAAGTAATQATGAAALTVAASAGGRAEGTGTASLSLAATGTARAAAPTSTASLTINASATAQVTAAGSASLNLQAGVAGSTLVATGDAALTLAASATAAVVSGGTASLALTAQGAPVAALGSTGTLQIVAAGQLAAQATAQATLVLLASATGQGDQPEPPPTVPTQQAYVVAAEPGYVVDRENVTYRVDATPTLTIRAGDPALVVAAEPPLVVT